VLEKTGGERGLYKNRSVGDSGSKKTSEGTYKARPEDAICGRGGSLWPPKKRRGGGKNKKVNQSRLEGGGGNLKQVGKTK